MIHYLLLFDAVSFLFFGLGCWFNPRLKEEFKRYGLSHYRKLTAILQLLGAAGIGMGYQIKLFWVLSTGGLALLMLLGVGVRVKIRDSFIQSFPALFYCLFNTYLFIHLLK